MHPAESLKFIVDHNVAKLARWLRMMGYDTIIFDQPDDWQMIRTALAENRIVITKDTGVMKRRVITSGKLQSLLVNSDDPEKQIQQVIESFQLDSSKPLSLCLECNVLLVAVKQEEIKDRVPPYVYQTKSQFVECPVCRRVYWQGTHWEAMTQTLNKLGKDKYKESREEKIT
jgi:uncharacterized protein with PIN domain